MLVQKNMDGHSELDLIAESFDAGIIGRLREDEFDQSRSGSDHFDGASGDDQDPGDDDDQRRRKKKYHRHTPNQIQELESYVLISRVELLFLFFFQDEGTW